MTTYTISNSDGRQGRAWDGVYDSLEAAKAALAHEMGWDEAVLVQIDTADRNGRPATAWCAYPDADEAGADEEGAYAPRIVASVAARDADVRALRSEAGAAGDQEQVELCDRALAGDDAARAECAAVIADARAQGAV